jgi:hypothetical protein
MNWRANLNSLSQEIGWTKSTKKLAAYTVLIATTFTQVYRATVPLSHFHTEMIFALI